MRLYFVRHGQSENNILWERTGSNVGRSDDPLLTDLGRQQAAAAGQFLKQVAMDVFENRWDANGKGITHIYSSLMLRAVETGTIISEALGLSLVGWKEIHEGGGIYLDDEKTQAKIGQPGKNRAFFEANYPQMILPDDLDQRGWWNRPHEERWELPDRAKGFVQELMRRHGNSQDWVAVVTHGDFYQRVLAVLMRMPKRDFRPDFPEQTLVFGEDSLDPSGVAGLPENNWFLINNAAVSRIDISESSITYAYLNRCDFIPADMIT